MFERLLNVLGFILERFMTELIKFYQFFISPWLANHCRFTPSCSNYAMQCFKKYDPFKATWKTCVRICKCHPLHPGGEDLP
jgi:putative membrane protein insertion efficiency factor